MNAEETLKLDTLPVPNAEDTKQQITPNKLAGEQTLDENKLVNTQ